MSFPISIQAHRDVADDHVNSCYCHYFACIKQSFCSFLFSFSHCPIPSLFLVLLLLCLLAFYSAFACILIVLPFLSSFLFLHHLLCSLCFYCLILLSPMYLMIMYSVVSCQFLFIISFIHSFSIRAFARNNPPQCTIPFPFLNIRHTFLWHDAIAYELQIRHQITDRQNTALHVTSIFHSYVIWCIIFPREVAISKID